VTIQRLRARLLRTSLLLRFGLASALLVIGLGLALGWELNATVEDRALAQSELMVAGIGQLAVQPLLVREDFESGTVSPGSLERLEPAVADLIADGTVSRIKVFDGEGTVIYSDDPSIIGDRQETGDGLSSALDGQVSSELQRAGEADGAAEVSAGALLEVYVPVRIDDDIVGVFELYLPYGPVAADAHRDVAELFTWLAGGLLVLWLCLLQIMSSASRRLRRHALDNERLAQRDTLTGLPNRAWFTTLARQAVRSAEHDGGGVAVLLLDIDRFREVNDTLGHHIGDQLLVEVGARLRQHIRDVDTVARVGGDEFAVLLPEVVGTDEALEVADRLDAFLRAPFLVDGVGLEIGASIGIACFPEHGGDATRLLQCADVAMCTAEYAHRAMAYDPALDVNTPSRLALYGELRRGIGEHQLTVHYQPQVDVGTGRVVGAEALVRWNHPVHGLVQPDDFIPLAEQTGLIRPMTVEVLRTALRDCRSWHAAGHALTVAVNLSVRSLLDEGLVKEVAGLLHESGLPASALELEITETTAMVDPVRSLVVLAELHALGVRLALDDYGTGHSSLSYLNQLPVDTLKIDRSFVTAMDTSDNAATIVRSTIDLAGNLGLSVVAEGVETGESWLRLAELGCDSAQGYWLARPEPAAGLLRVIDRLERRLRAGRRDLPVPA
jgi:diguanylate cyclase (GGDEF)-like protein